MRGYGRGGARALNASMLAVINYAGGVQVGDKKHDLAMCLCVIAAYCRGDMYRGSSAGYFTHKSQEPHGVCRARRPMRVDEQGRAPPGAGLFASRSD
jgi:hypothetical protein